MRRICVVLGVLLIPGVATAQDRAEPQTVIVVATRYVPETVKIAHGGELQITNLDPLGLLGHSITDDNVAEPRFGSAVAETGETRPVEGVPALSPGTYPFHCQVHTQIRGTLVVG